MSYKIKKVPLEYALSAIKKTRLDKKVYESEIDKLEQELKVSFPKKSSLPKINEGFDIIDFLKENYSKKVLVLFNKGFNHALNTNEEFNDLDLYTSIQLSLANYKKISDFGVNMIFYNLGKLAFEENFILTKEGFIDLDYLSNRNVLEKYSSSTSKQDNS